MKVLQIANFAESSGYSSAANNLAKAIYYTNPKGIACRNIQLTPNKKEPDDVIKKLLETKADDCDTLLIQSLPTFFEYDGRFKKCIGRFDFETHLNPSCCKKKIQLMDEVWVS
jgi:hypothetical protein